jgi:hypothetical protein
MHLPIRRKVCEQVGYISDSTDDFAIEIFATTAYEGEDERLKKILAHDRILLDPLGYDTPEKANAAFRAFDEEFRVFG